MLFALSGSLLSPSRPPLERGAAALCIQAESPLSLEPLSLERLRSRIQKRWRSLVAEADISTLAGGTAEDWASRSLFATRLPELPLNNCYLDDSHIDGAGRGLFASCDLPAGALVTLYPGDAIRIDAYLAGYNFVSCAATASDGSLVVAEAALLDRARHYEIEVEPPGSTGHRGDPPVTSVLGDPELVADPAYLGHMLNDGAICPSEPLRTVYKAASQGARNTETVPIVCESSACHLAIVATRDIRRGEELLLMYWASYWLAQLGMHVQPAHSTEIEDRDHWRGGSSRGTRHGKRKQGSSGDAEWDLGTPQRARRGRSKRRRGYAGTEDEAFM